MASAFSHVLVPAALKMALGKQQMPWRLLFWCCFLSVMPDFDVLAFHFDIPYESQWGHRGFTHSIFFACATGLIFMPFYKVFKVSKSTIFILVLCSVLSHGILDGLTNGGLGVAFFWPLSSERYFFPWQVIEVSPLSIRLFFTEEGLAVIKSELFYVALPAILFGSLGFMVRKKFVSKSPDNFRA